MMYGRMSDEEWEKRIQHWCMHWNADQFIRQALTKAFYDGREDAWSEIRAMGNAIEAKQKERDAGPEPVEKEK